MLPEARTESDAHTVDAPDKNITVVVGVLVKVDVKVPEVKVKVVPDRVPVVPSGIPPVGLANVGLAIKTCIVPEMPAVLPVMVIKFCPLVPVAVVIAGDEQSSGTVCRAEHATGSSPFCCPNLIPVASVVSLGGSKTLAK